MRHIFFIIAIIFFISGCSFYQNLNYTRPIYNTNKETKLKTIANEWKKTPYVLGGTTKKGADCSGFAQSTLAQFNTRIPRTTTKQLRSGIKVSKSKLKTGDLVFFKTGRGPNGMHVGIYMSKGKFIHLSTKGGVREVDLNSSYWKNRYIGARRY
ncbi:C40 family peptidase [Campylobacter coli]|nr:NlpC/P60 family protein [Campylobacter coli]EHP3401763.1 C40 family peptidase [Campylobacter coli]EIT6724769.1 C40 family peptidase [Campylobacter coli]EJC2326800.1 C40 family peptidase [Campylobacter coli]EJM4860904.1 C40 family peptidase [Campylobacter coli]